MVKKMKKIQPKPDNSYKLIKAIRGYKQGDILGEGALYKANVEVRDKKVRTFVEDNISGGNQKKILPGQLVMFNYFTPKTEEELKYYDAMPCTIFFDIAKTNEGPRVVGFNLHYYPPKLRYKIMNRIFEIYKSLYIESWNSPIKKSVNKFNYKDLVKALEYEGLDFGVRMYIPQLIKSIKPIPPQYWQKAVFTEGHFKKETRTQILSYWRKFIEKKSSL